MIVDTIRHTALVTRLGLLVSAAPMVLAIVFAIRPNEHRLALMRPLSLAGIFAAICNLAVGLANGLRAVAMEASSGGLQAAAEVMTAAVVPTFVAFACLTVAWLCVAIGMTRQS